MDTGMNRSGKMME